QPNNPPPVRLRLDSKIQKKQTRKAKTKKIEQFTAGQILGNKELRELWMRDVQKDPARFLSAKFEMQLRQQPLNTKKEVNKAK
ncbi:hypothetical protein KAJ27_17410, partial [bacterium]|nr:hypothetical protein [bacterium]